MFVMDRFLLKTDGVSVVFWMEVGRGFVANHELMFYFKETNLRETGEVTAGAFTCLCRL